MTMQVALENKVGLCGQCYETFKIGTDSFDKEAQRMNENLFNIIKISSQSKNNRTTSAIFKLSLK